MLDADVLKFIQQEERAYINKPYQSVFGLAFYRNTSLLDTEALEILPNLLIRTLNPISRRHQYRIKLLINMDLNELPVEALRRLRKHPKALLKIIAAMNGLLRNSPVFNKLLQTNTISEAHFSEIYRILTRHGVSNADAVDYYNLLPGISDTEVRSYGYNNMIKPDVMISYIVTERK